MPLDDEVATKLPKIHATTKETVMRSRPPTMLRSPFRRSECRQVLHQIERRKVRESDAALMREQLPDDKI